MNQGTQRGGELLDTALGYQEAPSVSICSTIWSILVQMGAYEN